MVNSKKIFITGGSGFIGNYLQKYIDGKTSIYDLEEPGFRHSANFIKGDVRDAEGLARAFNGHEIIILQVSELQFGKYTYHTNSIMRFDPSICKTHCYYAL